MTAVDHTHPDTDRPFGERVAFERGPTVAADGGDAGVADSAEAASDPSNEHRIRDVDHTPPADAEPNRVFERGREGRDGDR